MRPALLLASLAAAAAVRAAEPVAPSPIPPAAPASAAEPAPALQVGQAGIAPPPGGVPTPGPQPAPARGTAAPAASGAAAASRAATPPPPSRPPRLPMTFVYSTAVVSSSEVDARRRLGVGLDAALLARTPWFLAGGIVGDHVFVSGESFLFGGRAGVRRQLVGPLQADLFVDGGWQRFATEDLSRDVRHLTDTTATLPFVGVRLGLAWTLDRRGSWLGAAALLRNTVGRASATFSSNDCSTSPCVTRDETRRFGGAMYGIVLAAGVDFDLLATEIPPDRPARPSAPKAGTTDRSGQAFPPAQPFPPAPKQP